MIDIDILLYIVCILWVIVLVIACELLRIRRTLNDLPQVEASTQRPIEESLDSKLQDYQNLPFGHPLNRPMTSGRLFLEKKMKNEN